MKKSSVKKTKKKKTLKKLKEELGFYLENDEIDKALNISTKITELYPKNTYGYVEIIKIRTNSYTKLIEEDEIKEIKLVFEKLYEVSNKREKKQYKTEFDEYLSDCKEAYNLRKIKKDIIGKLFLKEEYEQIVSVVEEKVKNAKSSSKANIKGLYDLIKGLFFVVCLIFNLFNPNKLLIITIPFGIFGIITIYGFIDMNLSKEKKKKKQEELNNILIKREQKLGEYKNEINKLEESISFLNEQKVNSCLKIPKTFDKQISEYLADDEELIVKKIIAKFNSNKIDEFSSMLNENTNLVADEVLNNIDGILNDLNKENFNMKKITWFNYVILIALCAISIFSLIIIIKNFYELNLISFIVAFLVGIVSNIIYNIENGRHTKLIDTFNDNLCNCIFRTSLVYDLIYSWITNELSFTYNFIEIPIIFTLLFIGFVMLISMLKYQNLYKKLIK